jgi:hypothetical protein
MNTKRKIVAVILSPLWIPAVVIVFVWWTMIMVCASPFVWIFDDDATFKEIIMWWKWFK